MSKNSAGILLYNNETNQLRVLLVHPGGPLWANKDTGAWSIPKGEYGPEENPKQAALREFAEETGLTLPDTGLADLGQITQRSGKIVTAWAAEGAFDITTLRSNTFEIPWPPKTGRMRSFPEVDRAQWCDLDTAREKINPAQAELLERLLSLLATGSGGIPAT